MTDGILAIAWPTWFRLAAAGWALVFGAVWYDWLYAWPSPESPAVLPATGIAFACALAATVLPGTAALLNLDREHWPPKPPKPPEAAALSSLTVAALLGIAYGAVSGLALGMELRSLATVVVIGIAAFPLTFGLAFPMGIPLGCAWMVWSLAARNSGISSRAWTWLTAISAVGWALTTCLGIVLGHR